MKEIVLNHSRDSLISTINTGKHCKTTLDIEDNRSTNLTQAKLCQTINNGTNNLTLPIQRCATISRKTFVNSDDPLDTQQREKDGTPRTPELADQVNKFKREILTYIAECINTPINYGPHVAVAIANKTWYISINSDYSAEGIESKMLWTKRNIKRCYDELKCYAPTNDEANALLIAFKWADSSTTLKFIPSNVTSEHVEHGEMAIIHNLQTANTFTEHSTIPGYSRAFRVGGTKTPCLDCAWEMGMIPQDFLPQVNRGMEAGHTHDTPSASTIGTRRVTTTPDRGQGYPNWEHHDMVRQTALTGQLRARKNVLNLQSDTEQNQSCQDLKDAFARATDRKIN